MMTPGVGMSIRTEVIVHDMFHPNYLRHFYLIIFYRNDLASITGRLGNSFP